MQTNRQGGTGEVPYKVEDPVRRLYPAFTRRREHFIGRTAMLGVAACWAGEVRIYLVIHLGTLVMGNLIVGYSHAGHGRLLGGRGEEILSHLSIWVHWC